jgi:hypothetical protein
MDDEKKAQWARMIDEDEKARDRGREGTQIIFGQEDILAESCEIETILEDTKRTTKKRKIDTSGIEKMDPLEIDPKYKEGFEGIYQENTALTQNVKYGNVSLPIVGGVVSFRNSISEWYGFIIVQRHFNQDREVDKKIYIFFFKKNILHFIDTNSSKVDWFYAMRAINKFNISDNSKKYRIIDSILIKISLKKDTWIIDNPILDGQLVCEYYFFFFCLFVCLFVLLILIIIIVFWSSRKCHQKQKDIGTHVYTFTQEGDKRNMDSCEKKAIYKGSNGKCYIGCL